MRESPALDILELLMQRGATVSYTDPYVPTLEHAGYKLENVPFDSAVADVYDCAVVATDHDAFDWDRVAGLSLVVDTRNALKALARPSIFRL